MTPRGAFELTLAAGNEDCYGSIYFYEPAELKAPSSLIFRARSDRGRVGFSIQAAPEEAAKAAQTTHAIVAGEAWQRETFALGGSDVRGSLRVARVDVVAFPSRRGARDSHALIIRDFRFKALPASLRAASDQPAALAGLAPPERRASSIAPPPADKTSPKHPIPRMLWDRDVLLGAIALLLSSVALRKRRSRFDEFSPLLEINTRTWRSERDADGVVRIGGFRKMTTDHLREIKNTGFNAVWLMGLWQVGAKVRAISKNYGSDFQGSPFAISDYSVSEDLGTEADLRQFVERAHDAGLRVLADFVPNHMGLDSPWLSSHPEYFIHKPLSAEEERLSDDELMRRYPSYFPYRVPAYSGHGVRAPRTIMVAYGRDPYFYPWIDTAQLDYTQPTLRRQMIEVLNRLAKIVDGVRCDMAMLVLRDQVKAHRHPEMSSERFDQLMPEEFWTEAIRTVKRTNPHFLFIAETYWAMEGYLQHLGFDYTYNKPLYEAICHAFHTGHADSLLNFLRMLGESFLRKSVHFLENHDEERAMNALGEERQKGAAVLLATLPGLALFHEGQLDGKRERLPVQRVVPLQEEPKNAVLLDFYRRLLAATATPLFRAGRLQILYSNNPALVTYARIDGDARALVIVNCSGTLQRGVVHLSGLDLHNGRPFRLKDAFYPLKSPAARRKPGVRPDYVVPAAQLINDGLYVELEAFDAHLLFVERLSVRAARGHVRRWLRDFNAEWPLPRAARRLLGPALMRGSDAEIR